MFYLQDLQAPLVKGQHIRVTADPLAGVSGGLRPLYLAKDRQLVLSLFGLVSVVTLFGDFNCNAIEVI